MQLPRVTITLIFLMISIPATVLSQSVSASKRNNPYSPSPSGRAVSLELTSHSAHTAETELGVRSQQKDVGDSVVASMLPSDSEARRLTTPIANGTLPAIATAKPTEMYRIGIGDVISIDLQNSGKVAAYLTVQPDGTLDYPLAGPALAAAGLTTSELETQLRSKVKLFANPTINVKVKEFVSHKIVVGGLVDIPGEKSMQREAIPLFAVKAAAFVQKEANTAKVTRASGTKAVSLSLNDPATDNVYLHSGDAVEFVAIEQAGSYNVTEKGRIQQRQLSDGLRLTDAIQAIGGGKVTKVILKRKDAKGQVNHFNYDLASIRRGSTQNPLITAGDEIEIGD